MAFALIGPAASAQQASGTLMVTAIIAGSVGLRVSSPSGSDSANAVTVRTDPGKSVTVPVTVDVLPANVGSCVVLARLQSAPAAGTTWMIDGQKITDVTPVAFIVTGAHASTLDLQITVSASRAQQVANSVVFAAQAR